ncbi:hypothetical protein N7492_010259 [Penicillium capsulatum]|uniref:DUF3824 domain-containing protein n=1 Tax=Penicillium capsulatum TaxID=69766 RepID=A0A9W9HQV6_9EURO|nr:hypothetical protein N7492_010259 [Penicillium capsulatum]KAJ6112766.1 hypothetical protein N7512_008090 [Penicillium capsulatum]
MAYYADRHYYSPRDRPRRSYAADYYDDPRYARYERERPRRGSDDSVEEIQRDYPPGEDTVYERGYNHRRTRRPVYENVRRASSVSGYDPYYDAGYYRSSRPRRSRRDDDHRSRRPRYDSASSSSPSPPRHRRRKSFSEQALGALGLGGAAASSSRHSDRGRGRSQSRHRRRHDSSSRSRSDSRDRGGRRHRERSEQRIAQAARAALTAGAVEAFRSRKEPGEWTGAKGKRVLTAAVTAAGTDGLVDKDPNKHSKRHVVESTLAGLAANHFMNGGRSQSRSRDGRGRSSGRGGSGAKNIAATGALAAAGKEIYDRISRSRSRPRGRGGRDSDDEDDDEHRGSKRRSKSVSDYINKGMAALGLNESKSEHSRDRSRDRDDRGRDGRSRDDRNDRHGERSHRRDRDSRYDSYSDSDADDDYRSRDTRRGRGSRDVGRYRSMDGGKPTPQAPTSARRGPERSGCDCTSEDDSDLGDSSDEKKKRKKMRRDMMITSGLATVATVHAAHGLYGSMQKRKERMKQLEEGEITPQEARKRRLKANTMDAVSLGLAGLGIKGAYGEWKEVNEKRKESTNFQHECTARKVKRDLRRARSHGPSTRHRWPDEIEYAPSHDSRSYGHGVPYQDGNPYGATPQISY